MRTILTNFPIKSPLLSYAFEIRTVSSTLYIVFLYFNFGYSLYFEGSLAQIFTNCFKFLSYIYCFIRPEIVFLSIIISVSEERLFKLNVGSYVSD